MTRLVTLLCLSVSLASATAEETWTQFRGPNGSGLAAEANPPIEIHVDQAKWSIDLPPGHSSPVLSDTQVFLTAVEGDRLITLAFDRETGNPVFRQTAPQRPMEKVHATNSPAASTPLVTKDRVFVYFGSFGLLCYSHTGKELWQKAIETPKSLYGMSTSPIAYKDMVILVLDDERNLPDSKLSRSKIIALKQADGSKVWEASRPLLRSGWSTPTLWKHDQGTDLVVLGHRRLCAYDPDTGVEKWFIDGFSRETIAVPIIGNGRLYASAAMLGGVSDDAPDPEPFWTALLPFDTDKDGKISREEMIGDFTYPLRPDLPIGHPGFGIPVPSDPDKRKKRIDGFLNWVDKDKDGYWTKEELTNHLSFDRGKPNLMAINPGGQGDISETHIEWALHKNIPEIPSPVFHNDRIYLVRDGGVLSCIDATNGKTIYRKRLGASGHYSPSPVIADGHLYILSNEGQLSIVPTGDKFEVLHRHDFDEPINATPSISGDTIYIRTASKLHAFSNDG